MTKIRTGWLAALLVLAPAGSLIAHHSLANFDTTTAVRVKGTVVRVHLINPHSFIYLEEKLPDGVIRRWAIEGPSAFQINRGGRQGDVPMPGANIEVCGYVPKEATVWQIQNPDRHGTSMAGRLITAELLVISDGEQRSWGDYGVHKCFDPAYRDQHSRD